MGSRWPIYSRRYLAVISNDSMDRSSSRNGKQEHRTIQQQQQQQPTMHFHSSCPQLSWLARKTGRPQAATKFMQVYCVFVFATYSPRSDDDMPALCYIRVLTEVYFFGT